MASNSVKRAKSGLHKGPFADDASAPQKSDPPRDRRWKQRKTYFEGRETQRTRVPPAVSQQEAKELAALQARQAVIDRCLVTPDLPVRAFRQEVVTTDQRIARKWKEMCRVAGRRQPDELPPPKRERYAALLAELEVLRAHREDLQGRLSRLESSYSRLTAAQTHLERFLGKRSAEDLSESERPTYDQLQRGLQTETVLYWEEVSVSLADYVPRRPLPHGFARLKQLARNEAMAFKKLLERDPFLMPLLGSQVISYAALGFQLAILFGGQGDPSWPIFVDLCASQVTLFARWQETLTHPREVSRSEILEDSVMVGLNLGSLLVPSALLGSAVGQLALGVRDGVDVARFLSDHQLDGTDW